MKMYKKVLPLLIAAILFVACNNDDNSPKIIQLTQEEQNRVDDEAIPLLLKDYYLNEQGKITEFSNTDLSDDDKTPLSEIAEYNTQGFWIVKRPDYTADGKKVSDVEKEKILLQYEMFTFQAKTNQDKDSVSYSTPSRFSSTIDTKGYPIWDPNFYYKPLSDADIENNIQKSWYEIEGFQEGIKAFNSANKNMTDQPFVDFQGLIIIPSRLAYGRDTNAGGLIKDQSVIINFQLYKVEDR